MRKRCADEDHVRGRTGRGERWRCGVPPRAPAGDLSPAPRGRCSRGVYAGFGGANTCAAGIYPLRDCTANTCGAGTVLHGDRRMCLQAPSGRGSRRRRVEESARQKRLKREISRSKSVAFCILSVGCTDTSSRSLKANSAEDYMFRVKERKRVPWNVSLPVSPSTITPNSGPVTDNSIRSPLST